jgi:hypothetical protein
VHVFRIPAQKSAEGHRASDWPKDPNWTGKLKIVAKGRTAAIILSDERNQVFAICQVTDDSSVQKVLDSGRYFVLRITNQQGRHAYIGIAFNERNDAFDFNVALSEFRSELEREEKAAKFFSEHTIPVDLTLKEGEKIKIKLVWFIEFIIYRSYGTNYYSATIMLCRTLRKAILTPTPAVNQEPGVVLSYLRRI